MKMQTIVEELFQFASQYKNCENLEVIIREKYSELKGIKPPILFVIASGFLQGLPKDQSLSFLDNNPHLSPFKNSILPILDNSISTNPFIESTKSVINSHFYLSESTLQATLSPTIPAPVG